MGSIIIGEYGELASYYFTKDSEYEIAGFTADDKFVNSDTFLDVPLVPHSKVKEAYPPSEYFAHVALSYNKLNRNRSDKYFAMREKGYTLASYVCSKSVYWPDLTTGDNCFILENQTIQPKVKIGSNVMIWSGNHIGHGCVVRDHTYISSHVCIAGHVNIGSHCFLGINASIRDFVKIGNRVFVAMGAEVTKNIKDDAVVLGAKSSVILAENPLAKKIKRKYFNL